ncbi:group I intron-associated PD-(D/E)XK endonuclease [Halarchaeum salinum]|uniref:PD(D/E)XK endonuclease domain-containing protein n=1 Tax=Halarchaeum salinum TaxID=489912 RepID=A0AAV3S646_9EURY
MEPHRKGDLTEAIVIAELKRRDIPVSVPFGDNERYDLLAEDDSGSIWKLQVKTGRYRDGKVLFKGKSQHTNASGHTYRYYDGDVDYFLVNCDEVDGLYLVPESEVGSSMSLRIADAKQDHRTINWATDYDFDEQWPPSGSTADDWRNAVVDDLREHGIDVLDARESDAPYDLLLRTADGTLYRTSLRPGSVSGGRVRFDTGRTNAPGPSVIDLVLVRCQGTGETYLIERDAYDESISLRVEPTRNEDTRTNRAADYTLNRRWPPA